MWASTKASSVTECPRRSPTQRVSNSRPSTPEARSTTARAVRRSHRRSRGGGGVAAAGGGPEGDGAGTGADAASVGLMVRLRGADGANRWSRASRPRSPGLRLPTGSGSWGNLVEWGRRDPHHVFEPGDRRQVVVDRVEVVLLGAGQRGLGVGDLGGGRVALDRPRPDEAVILAGLLHRRAGAVDPQSGRHEPPVILVDLERDRIG